MLGGGMRREERLLSRMRVCVDRDGVFEDLSEGFFVRYDRSRIGAYVM
jgi:hypothetical protein